MKAWSERDWSWSIEGLSLHSYTVPQWPPSLPSTEFGEDDYALILQTTLKMDHRIALHSAIMDKYDPEKKVALVVDEWGVWLAETPGTPEGFLQQQNSHARRDPRRAQLQHLRPPCRSRARANIAQMVNVLQALILTDGPKMVLTPTYWVHKMYLPMQDATFVPVALRCRRISPWRDHPAGRRCGGDARYRGQAVARAGQSRPARGPRDRGRRVRPAGAPRAGRGADRAHVNSINTFAAPDTVVPKPIAGTVRDGRVRVTLPGKSVAMLALEP